MSNNSSEDNLKQNNIDVSLNKPKREIRNINKQTTERETRLNRLKNNIKDKNMSAQKIYIPTQPSMITSEEDVMMTKNFIHNPKIDEVYNTIKQHYSKVDAFE